MRAFSLRASTEDLSDRGGSPWDAPSIPIALWRLRCSPPRWYVLVGREQAPQKRIRPGKPDWFLQDDDAILGENPQHFSYNPRNIKMVDQGDTENYIHRFIGEAGIVS